MEFHFLFHFAFWNGVMGVKVSLANPLGWSPGILMPGPHFCLFVAVVLSQSVCLDGVHDRNFHLGTPFGPRVVQWGPLVEFSPLNPTCWPLLVGFKVEIPGHHPMGTRGDSMWTILISVCVCLGCIRSDTCIGHNSISRPSKNLSISSAFADVCARV